MGRYATANDIVNAVAVEVGLVPQSDVLNSDDLSFSQLVGLLNGAGQEMVELNQWQILTKPFQITTQDGDSGTYPLPDDFSYMIDQTGWDLTNDVPVYGPLSAQDWSYLKGRDLASNTIYVSFRLVDGEFDLFPQPPPVDTIVSFEYQSRNWVKEQTVDTFKDSITQSSDIVLFEPILIKKFLKVKFLDAKGFPSAAARQEFENMFDSRTGKDRGAPILNAAAGMRGFHYLDWYNMPDTRYGSS